MASTGDSYNTASIVRMHFRVSEGPIAEVSEGFVSHCLDTTTLIRKEWCLDLESDKFVNLCKPLAPGYLHFGGTPSNRLIFRQRTDEEESKMKRRCSHNEEKPKRGRASPTGDAAPRRKKPRDEDEVVMTCADWDRVNFLARRVGWKLLFTLNSHTKTPRGEWDHKNAEELLKYMN